MTMRYNAPNGQKSTIDGAGSGQVNTFFWQKKALIEAQKEMYFSQLADTTAMPKHYGKEITLYHYLPLLDARNVNDQGIDANEVTLSPDDYFITIGKLVHTFAVEADATAAAAAINAIEASVAVKSGAATPWTVTLSKAKLAAATAAEADDVLASFPMAHVRQESGNLYGSSKDVGLITSKIPELSEAGGRVNRVGFTRLQIKGSIQKFGLFTEFSDESLMFDSDSELYSHISRELVVGATQLTEAVLQKDLLNAAGTILYAGAAVSNDTITGEGATVSEVDYEDMIRLARMLNDNRTPKQTKVITGSRMVDTRVIPAARAMFIGSELERTIKGMKDLHLSPAFIPIEKYASAGNVMTGEIGSVDAFRIISVPEMLHWAGAGAAVGTNGGYSATGGRYDVFPMLVVGEGSFTTIGFQTGGKMMKFQIITKMPGEKTADRSDPYGEMGFSSIKWWYGFLGLRTERIGLVKTVARI